MGRLPGTSLIWWGRNLLAAAGATPAAAARTAAYLVEADLAGHPAAGMARLPAYLQAIQVGQLRPAAQPVLVRAAPGFVEVAGDGCLGEEAVGLAAQRLGRLAGTAGVAVGTVRGCYPLGRLSPVAERLARAGLAAVAWANGGAERPVVYPAGGGRPCLSDGAMAGAVPCGDGGVLVLDMGLAGPEPSGLQPADGAGAAAAPGARPPFDGAAAARGYGLCLVAELLAGVLTGAGGAGDGPATGGAPSAPPAGAGVLLLAVAAGGLGSGPGLGWQVERLCAFIQSAGAPAGGVWVPGELEARRRARQLRLGVALHRPALDQLRAWSTRLGVQPPGQAVAGCGQREPLEAS